MTGPAPIAETESRADTLRRLGGRSIVFIGLMGAGKTVIGRKVAQALSLPFVDTDHEIETASRMSIPELFEHYGEPEFRALEQRVVSRVMREGPQVVSTGGGAFMNAETRAMIISEGLSVWLKADLDLLMERVAKRQNRPLLHAADPRGVMARLMAERYPIYAQAHIMIETRDDRKETIATEALQAIGQRLREEDEAR
ncbi:MAG: shikimate kinase [Rhizobiaceae bacterium]|nr:shikimate kinase [Rhizobiaceae bacterium]MCV0407616.1 shikimate kinase [Rhizobiaceae bacterium]